MSLVWLLTGCEASREEVPGDIDQVVSPAQAFQTPDTVVRVQPLTQGLNVGDFGNVQIVIDNVTNLAGLELGLQFDPNIIQIQDTDPAKEGAQIQPGDFLSPDFVQTNLADNTTGNILYIVTQVSPTPPASGSGVLATLTFQAMVQGTSNLTLATVKLADDSAQPISATLQSGQVIVGDGTGEPTPTFTPTSTTPTSTPIPGTDTPTPTATLIVATVTPIPTPTPIPPLPTATSIPPETTIPPGATVGFCYRVEPGETLASISHKFGVNPRYLNLVNDLYPPGYVYTHQALFIPQQVGHGPNVYIVEEGDNLILIADQCHLPVSHLAFVNCLPEDAVLQPGHVLLIPIPPFPPPSRYPYNPYPQPGPPSVSPPVLPPPGGCNPCISPY
ncbi:MAG: LysM peptidoglycan-binding domain-containing protein [Anaerolineae bacterium]|nr:LysM peptidoglycan-binding domain-containing protein [Anaerolineae bacterium]